MGPTQFSRNGTTQDSGKLTERIDIPAPLDLKEKLIGLAVLNGKPSAEYGRMLLTKAIEGELAYLRSVGAIPDSGDGRNVP